MADERCVNEGEKFFSRKTFYQISLSGRKIFRAQGKFDSGRKDFFDARQIPPPEKKDLFRRKVSPRLSRSLISVFFLLPLFQNE